MRPFVAVVGLLGGLVVSLGMFAGGIAVAMFLPDGEPERRLGAGPEVAELWAQTPRKVERSEQDFERLPAIQTAAMVDSPRSPEKEPETVEAWSEVDPVTTSAATGASADESIFSSRISSAHLEWCADRYRSYRPDENVYTSYSGQVRTCISPYSDESVTASEEMVLAGDEEYYLPAADETDVVMSDHVSECFSRYRSYRPEDNTYQPYDGGPRRQCQ